MQINLRNTYCERGIEIIAYGKHFVKKRLDLLCLRLIKIKQSKKKENAQIKQVSCKTYSESITLISVKINLNCTTLTIDGS